MTDATTPAQSRPLALVTGGGTGIGAAIARRLSRDGFDVVVAGRRREKLDEVVADIEGAGGSARALVMDVTDPESVTDGRRLARRGATSSSTTPAARSA